MKLLQSTIILFIVLSGYVQAIVNGKNVAENDWRSVVFIEFINPDNGLKTSCTGIIISSDYAITSASCVMHEESSKQVSKVKVCIGQKRPFNSVADGCFETEEIYSHHKYISNSIASTANNLAYIKFKNSLNLKQLKVKPAKLITPGEFSNLVSQNQFPDITWVGFDAKNLRDPILGIKHQGTVNGAEFDFQSRSIVINSTHIRLGNHYQGTASFIQTPSGEWRLLGLVSESTPDNVIVFYPEINPCEEDPVLVRYPKPLMQVTTHLTVFPIAACGMALFVESNDYKELSCKNFLEYKLSLSDEVDNENPTALRQYAQLLYQSNTSADDAGEIYKYLYLANKGGDKKAPIILSGLLYDGELFTKNNDKAKKLIKDLVKEKNPAASLLQAKLMLFPKGETEISASSSERDILIYTLLKIAADSGLVDAQYLVARLYQLGIGVKQSHKNAYHWYAIAAMQGHSDSQYQLGMQWSDGRGYKIYPEVAKFWIEQAAARGHLAAQNQLGILKPVASQ
ncbi:MAG: trypsin-like serine protease [Gammaproteobacteria bacterium]|nr:trypsin-like serine protease [Gammaproteobacteria bacterium]